MGWKFIPPNNWYKTGGSTWLIVTSGATWYRRGVSGTEYHLDYSANAGVTWETIVILDPTEDNVIIDAGKLYRHRIVGTTYKVDQTLTSTGYAGAENTDWENLYST